MTMVSLGMAYRSFREVSGRLDTRLDTPPSIKRRHPDSRIAQLVLHRPLHRQIGRLLSLEDAIDVARRAPVLVREIGTIGNKPAGRSKIAKRIDRRKSMPRGSRNDGLPVDGRRRAKRHDQATIRAAG